MQRPQADWDVQHQRGDAQCHLHAWPQGHAALKILIIYLRMTEARCFHDFDQTRARLTWGNGLF